MPGSLDALTGGYIYDRKILAGLAELGWRTRAHALDASFPEPTADALRHAAALLESLPDGRCVVIDGLALAGLGAAIEQERERLAVVALIHHPLAHETGLDRAAARRLERAERSALELVRRVVVTSSWTRDALAGFGVPPDRIHVVEPGTDPAPLTARERRDSLRLLCVGTLTPRKGHAVLFEALAGLAERAWTLRCAGSLERDPATASALAAQIERLGLGDRIELLGELEPAEVEREYAGADLFVLPSYLEGYGMAFAEALAHGLPVVATDAGAIPQTVPPDACLLVPPGDPVALERALASLMDSPEQLDSLAAAAAEAGAGLPTWGDSSRRFARALETLAPARR